MDLIVPCLSFLGKKQGMNIFCKKIKYYEIIKMIMEGMSVCALRIITNPAAKKYRFLEKSPIQEAEHDFGPTRTPVLFYYFLSACLSAISVNAKT